MAERKLGLACVCFVDKKPWVGELGVERSEWKLEERQEAKVECVGDFKAGKCALPTRDDVWKCSS